jgi:hypothetical protein
MDDAVKVNRQRAVRLILSLWQKAGPQPENRSHGTDSLEIRRLLAHKLEQLECSGAQILVKDIAGVLPLGISRQTQVDKLEKPITHSKLPPVDNE